MLCPKKKRRKFRWRNALHACDTPLNQATFLGWHKDAQTRDPSLHFCVECPTESVVKAMEGAVSSELLRLDDFSQALR
jgi:hypothetical protein